MRTKAILALIAVTFLFTGFETRADDKFTKLLLKKADKLYRKRATKGNGEKAREAYEKVLAVDPDNIKARWKLGMTMYWLGTHVSSKEKKMELFEAGIRYCQEAVKQNPDCVPCQFWLAVSYGTFGEAKGILQSLGLVPYMREALEKVKELDDKYEYGGAYRVLGRLEFKLPSGDNDKAIEYLKKAIGIGPTHLMNHRFLAEVLIKEGKKDEAKEALKTIIDTPRDKLLKSKKPEMKEEQEEARKLWLEHWEKYW